MIASLEECPDLEGIETLSLLHGSNVQPSGSLEECPDLEGIETHMHRQNRTYSGLSGVVPRLRGD